MNLPKGYSIVVKNKTKYIMSNAINNNSNFLQAFTLRKGSSKSKSYDLLNSDIKKIEKALGIKYVSTSKQVHGDRVVILKNKVLVDVKKTLNTSADGIISNIKGIAAGVRLADCVGTVIIDPTKNVVAVVHSGWKGVANKIPVKAVKQMEKIFSSKPEDMIAAISPAIGPCCYEVGIEVYNQLQRQPVFSNIFIKKHKRTYMNLWKAVKNLLMAEGLKAKNIHICDICTACNPELFYSYRRDKGITGRQLAIGAVIKPISPFKKR